MLKSRLSGWGNINLISNALLLGKRRKIIMLNSNLIRPMALITILASLAACSGVTNFEAKTPDGKVTDRVSVLAAAVTPFAPSVAVPVKVVNGKFVSFGDVKSTGSIVEQLMPVVTAAGAIEAARSIRPSNNTNIANGGNATAESSSFSYAEATATQKLTFNACKPVKQHGHSYMKGGC